jgi:carbonic anhydrase/acetyltransferase-like protein (isoleucine patch superfamily)
VVKVFRTPALQPFEGLREPEEMPVWDLTLGQVGAWAIGEAGFSIAEGGPLGPCLVLRERVVVRPEALKAAWDAGQRRGSSCSFQLGGEIGAFLETLPGGKAGPVLAYLHSADDSAPLDELEQVRLDPDEKHLNLGLHKNPMGLYVSDRLWLPVDHWVDLLWANLLGLGPRVWGLALGRPAILSLIRMFWAAMRALSFRHEKIASKLNVLGPGARIHSSATVEASVLGRGVSIGPGAVVRGCVLGEGAKVEALALCEGLVVGAHGLVQRQALMKYGVLGANAAIGGATQLSVVGCGSELKRGAYGMDQNFSGPVRFLWAGSLVEAPFGLLGVCLGEGSQLGAGVSLAPGRVLSPGVTVVGQAITHPANLAPSVVRARDGRLEPVE